MARTLEDLNLDDVQVRKLFVCGSCGAIASTNSTKHYSAEFRNGEEGQPTREELEELVEDRDISVDYERGVRLTPPCPCGNDLYNSLDVLALHYDATEVPNVRR